MFWLKLLQVLKHPFTREIAIALLAVFSGALLEKRKKNHEDQ